MLDKFRRFGRRTPDTKSRGDITIGSYGGDVFISPAIAKKTVIITDEDEGDLFSSSTTTTYTKHVNTVLSQVLVMSDRMWSDGKNGGMQ